MTPASTQSPALAELRLEGRLLHLTLNRPKANILDAAMIAGIREALAVHANCPKLRGVCFEGAGDHFCFGASVEEHRAEQAAAMLDQFHGLFRDLMRFAVPSFAVVRGQCLGGGMELASFCTAVFAEPSARFAQPEIKLAVFPPMASVLLPWRIGGGEAAKLCVSGAAIGAAEAERLGLIQSLSDDASAAFKQWYEAEVAPCSPSSLRFAERAARLGLQASLDRDLPELERLYLEELMRTHDANEGIQAFLEKRPPEYATEEQG
jgi:cyclohexa-1,5-dienecarbonyl-CoA hydratase